LDKLLIFSNPITFFKEALVLEEEKLNAADQIFKLAVNSISSNQKQFEKASPVTASIPVPKITFLFVVPTSKGQGVPSGPVLCNHAATVPAVV